MQLSSFGAATLLAFFVSSGVRAEVVTFDTTHSLFLEAPTRTKMMVYTPGTTLEAKPAEWLKVRGGWEADVVSGASIATKAGSAYQATHPGTDVVTAASVKDFRNQAIGSFSLKKEDVSLTAGYAYSTENDYKSHSFNVSAKAEAYEHNTLLELSYARNFDRVCDRVQSTFDTSVRYRALEDSEGCFSGSPTRTSRDLGIDRLQGSWSQSWTPIFTTQLVYTAQILHGFQSNPYRSVILGEGLKSQEHHPENRARHALALRGNLFLKPIRGAIRASLRGYLDSWQVASGTGDLELEKYFGQSFRALVRGRFYKQSGALFWSDDYTGGQPPLGPKGQYWTGDRELSPFFSVLVGLRVKYLLLRENERLLGVMEKLELGASFDTLFFRYDEYTLGGVPITNARAYIAGLSLTAIF